MLFLVSFSSFWSSVVWYELFLSKLFWLDFPCRWGAYLLSAFWWLCLRFDLDTLLLFLYESHIVEHRVAFVAIHSCFCKMVRDMAAESWVSRVRFSLRLCFVLAVCPHGLGFWAGALLCHIQELSVSTADCSSSALLHSLSGQVLVLIQVALPCQVDILSPWPCKFVSFSTCYMLTFCPHPFLGLGWFFC